MSSLLRMRIYFRTEAIDKLLITKAAWNPSAKASVMFIAAVINVINRCPWSAASRAAPFVAGKNTKSSISQQSHPLYIKYEIVFKMRQTC